MSSIVREAIDRLASRAKNEHPDMAIKLAETANTLAITLDILSVVRRADEHTLQEYSKGLVVGKPALAGVTSLKPKPMTCHICSQKLEGTRGLDNLHCPDADPAIWMDKLANEAPTLCVTEGED